MNKRQIVAAIAGIIMALLGLLWFFQGTGLLTICPILCFADCQCITGGSPFWEITGALVFTCGIIVLALTGYRKI
jgi:hypothetical protein